MRPFSVFIVRLRVLAPGQTMAEYALILATIALISAALVQSGGVIVKTLVDNVSALFH
jgi:Flp pilus assembly pilin Flp